MADDDDASPRPADSDPPPATTTNSKDIDAVPDADLLAELDRESRQWNKDTEIERILRAFRLNAYAVLGLVPGVAASDIKVAYRKTSLLIHPDKTTNPRAPEAFDRLAKAQQALMDDKARGVLDEAIADARRLVLREQGWTVDSPELKEQLFLDKLWPEKIKFVLVEDELRKQRQAKGQMQEEGRQQRKEEEEAEKKKRKRDYEKDWEDSRDQRIGSWREFQNKKSVEGEKKRKKEAKKMKVLG